MGKFFLLTSVFVLGFSLEMILEDSEGRPVAGLPDFAEDVPWHSGVER